MELSFGSERKETERDQICSGMWAGNFWIVSGCKTMDAKQESVRCDEHERQNGKRANDRSKATSRKGDRMVGPCLPCSLKWQCELVFVTGKDEERQVLGDSDDEKDFPFSEGKRG